MRLLDGQVRSALRELRGVTDEAAIHAARRHIKKARATLRLRDGDLRCKPLAHCDDELRAAGRALSANRDAAVLLRTIGTLTGSDPVKSTAKALQSLRETLPAPVVDASAVQIARHALREARFALAGPALGECDFDALANGFAITYRNGRRALSRALADPDARRLHTLRKALKHHVYQLRLLRPLWPGPLGALHTQADQAAELLGLHHDCAVLRAQLPGSTLILAARAHIDALAAQRQSSLSAAALCLCQRLYAQRSRCHVQSLKACWKNPLPAD